MMRNNATKKVVLLAAASCLVFISAMFLLIGNRSEAASKGPTSSKETQLKLLKLEEARVSLQTAIDLFDDRKAEFEDMKALYAQDVVTGKEVSDMEAEMKNATRNLELARIDLAKTALNFLQDVTHISIVEAFQYMDMENNRHMTVRLKNDSDLNMALVGLGDGVPEANIAKNNVPGLLTIENLFVSVKVGGTNVGDPFEIKVQRLPLNEEAVIDFKLNSPADEVTLNLKYHGTEDSQNIYLRRQSVDDVVRVTSLQFAQEGQLGGSVEYGLELERLAENEATYTLGLAGLPDKYRYRFTDKGTQLSQVKFSPGMTKMSLSLKITVPEKLPDDEMKVPLRFFAMVGEEEPIKYAEKKGTQISTEELATLKIGVERLELIPSGVGKFEINFPTMYFEMKSGDKIETKMTVKNTGSVRLDDIRFTVQKPADWEVRMEPEEIDLLEPRKEVEVKMTMQPPATVEVGAYEVRLEGTTEYEGATVKTDQKNIRVQVSAKANLALSVAIMGGVILFILIIAVVTIKVSRR